MLRRLLALSLLPALAAAQVPSAKVIERYKQLLEANPVEGTALDRLWQAYANEGRTGALMAEFEGKQTFAAQMMLGLLLRKAGRDADAVAAFQRALTFDPKNPAPALALGRAELAAHPQQAVIWFETAADLLPPGPQKTEALLQLGAAALAAADLTKATEAWEKTVTFAPDDLSLRQQLADTYVRNQLGPNAIPHLEVIAARGAPQERAQAFRQIGAIHQARGDQDAAITALEKALAFTSPGNWLRNDLEGQLIRLHQRYRRTPELEEKWLKFAAENPRDLGAYLQLIDLYERLGDHTQQLTWLEKLVAVASKNLDYRLRLARLLAQMDLVDRAVAAYDELLGSEPRNIELVFERARLDVQREQTDAAGARIAALLARSDNDEGIRQRALDFYQAHRLYPLAEKHLREDAQGGNADAIVSLATFYFARHREAEARATLARLVRETDPPEKRAAAHFRMAGEYKSQNDLTAATASVRAAIELDGEKREYHFMLGELESGAGRYVAAETAFERAFALSRTPEEAGEADQRLYDALRNQVEPIAPEPSVSIPRPDSAASVTSAAAQGYLLKLLRAAVENPTESGWLRVARWQQWSRNGRGALDAAERALALNPDSIPVHDFLARLSASDPQNGSAQQHLTELARLDAANRPAYLRRLGQVQLQASQVEDALKTFQQIVGENPGDLEALHDLAIAQQRADQWKESLETLKQLHAVSPAPRKHDVVTALLRVYQRLGQRQQAAELLLQQIDAQPDADRFPLFADLLAHCTKHGLLDWLRTELDKRQKLRVGDYFTEVALGRVLKAQGNKAAAFEVLADAALSAPNPGEALPELVREAEELHRIEAAVQLQERYVRVVPQNGPDGWLRLAALQERSLQAEAASRTWARLVAKFPRDVQVLEKAAVFERGWGLPERALALLRRVHAIEPSNPRTLGQLAELELSDGDPAEAEKCLEQILAQTEPEKPGAPVRYPDVRPDDPSRLELSYRTTVRRRSGRPSADALKALRTFWFEKPEIKVAPRGHESRLETIRDLAEIVAAKGDPASLAQWVERWQKVEAGPTERLWALYFSGASGPLLDEVQKLMAAAPEDTGPVNAFIWLALRTGEFERLGAWNSDRLRTPSERDFLMIAVQQYLDELRGPLPSALVETVFPDGHRTNLWHTASELAQRGHYRFAVQLGERVLDRLTTQRAECAFELSQWQIQLGRRDDAIKALRSAIPGAYDTLNTAWHGTVRALYLLLPPRERTALLQEVESTLDEVQRPVQTALTRALLAGLSGDQKNAIKQIDRLLELRPMLAPTDERASAATRRWDFVLVAGVQFVNWQLPDLAAHLWNKALSDSAAIALEIQQPAPMGDSVRARVIEVRTRTTALKLMRGEPSETDAVLDEYARHAPPDGLLPLAETLESFNASPLAVTIYRRLWSSEPANPHALRNALGACRNAGDWNTAEEILTRVVTEGHFKQNAVAQRDLVTQLVEALVHRGDLERAIEHLTVSIAASPPDARALARLAELQQRAGKNAEAEATFHRALSVEPANTTIRLSFAALLDGAGRTIDALDVLERVAGGDIDARLAALNLKAGRLEEALAALERVPETDRPRVALSLANDLATGGDAARAIRLLRSALSRTRDERMAFSLQSRLVELLPADSERAAILREVRRLRQCAGSDYTNYFALLQREAPRLGLEKEVRDELIHAWDGARGDVSAGAAWFVWQAGRDEAGGAAKTWAQLVTHPALDVSALQTVLESFPENAPNRLTVLEKLARSDAADPKRLTTWAEALLAAKKGDQAKAVGAELAARAVFNPDLLGSAAELFLMLGDGAHAREFYRRATAMDPAGQKVDLHFSYVRLLLQQKQFADARTELRLLSRNPAARTVPVILEYLAAAGHLDDYDQHLADFPLAMAAWLELRNAVFGAQLERRNLAGAVRMVENFPFLLDGTGAKRLREAAKASQQFEGVVLVMENVVAQGAKDVERELAELLADWAEADLAALQVDAALTRLDRAHALLPGSWRVAEQLVKLRLERQEPQLAAKVLQAFLATDPTEAERDKAQQMLTRISGA